MTFQHAGIQWRIGNSQIKRTIHFDQLLHVQIGLLRITIQKQTVFKILSVRWNERKKNSLKKLYSNCLVSFFEVIFECAQPQTWTIVQFGVHETFLRGQNGAAMFPTKVPHLDCVCRCIDRHQFGRPVRVRFLLGPNHEMWLRAHQIESTVFGKTQITFVAHANAVNRLFCHIPQPFDDLQCLFITVEDWKT